MTLNVLMKPDSGKGGSVIVNSAGHHTIDSIVLSSDEQQAGIEKFAYLVARIYAERGYYDTASMSVEDYAAMLIEGDINAVKDTDVSINYETVQDCEGNVSGGCRIRRTPKIKSDYPCYIYAAWEVITSTMVDNGDKTVCSLRANQDDRVRPLSVIKEMPETTKFAEITRLVSIGGSMESISFFRALVTKLSDAVKDDEVVCCIVPDRKLYEVGLTLFKMVQKALRAVGLSKIRMYDFSVNGISKYLKGVLDDKNADSEELARLAPLFLHFPYFEQADENGDGIYFLILGKDKLFSPAA